MTLSRRTLARLFCFAAMLVATTAFAVTPPPANGKFDYQLGGAYEPEADVAIVVRDRLATPVPGIYNVCYVNAFQTQPGEAAWWKTHHPDLLLRKGGRYVIDPHWPDELLFDTSIAAKRDALLAVVGEWIDRCAQEGFDAMEPDNLDSWTRSAQQLEPSDNLAFARLLVTRAHASGLAIAQKNASEYASQGATDIGFDFAVVEGCQVWSECEAYTAAYGQQVYEIEYSDVDRDSHGKPVAAESFFNTACKARGDRISVVYRDRGVSPPSRKGTYVYRSC
ncbi:endo alpha-1,4 polygalactosaminidase [Pseudoxanthomonas sp. PXM02]|uniref:endo alpha-1,4 polygalactosaminidase n=1 Tax=Pseudoxanthomonas sp. PXM02 TaxID=2769294 RepID=UPI0017800131|nr:endo alpha-1,4 polygalactosaminidase [Pseudoxanthomonas sp. PXM02]MBD9479538.1 endo alpha-1,4 polygalactosaminidase [Pseudoxanthomonas sp. PXM02]